MYAKVVSEDFEVLKATYSRLVQNRRKSEDVSLKYENYSTLLFKVAINTSNDARALKDFVLNEAAFQRLQNISMKCLWCLYGLQ